MYMFTSCEARLHFLISLSKSPDEFIDITFLGVCLSFLSLYHCVISYSLQVIEIESRLGSGSLKQLSRASFLYIYRICLLRL